MKNFFHVFISFFQKPKIVLIISFILLYRFGEAQLVKIAPLFILDDFAAGGLGLTNVELGFIQGTMGIIMLTLGGILGGLLVAKNGLKYWILWMALAMKLPDIVYVIMAYAQMDNILVLSLIHI